MHVWMYELCTNCLRQGSKQTSCFMRDSRDMKNIDSTTDSGKDEDDDISIISESI